MKHIARITQNLIWHGANCYCTCISTCYCLLYKIWRKSTYFSEKSQQMQNVWKRGHNYSKWAQSIILFYKHKYNMVPNYCTKYEQNHNIRVWDMTPNTQNLWNIAIITPIWDRAKFYFTCIIIIWYLIKMSNMKKIHWAIKEECAWMDWQTERQIDLWSEPVPIFPNSAIVERGVIMIKPFHKQLHMQNSVTWKDYCIRLLAGP